MRIPSNIVGSLALRENFKRARAALGMTQGELASALNVSLQTISNYETGRAYIQGYRATSLRRLLERAPEPRSTRQGRHEGGRRSTENLPAHDPIPSLNELFGD